MPLSLSLTHTRKHAILQPSAAAVSMETTWSPSPEPYEKRAPTSGDPSCMHAHTLLRLPAESQTHKSQIWGIKFPELRTTTIQLDTAGALTRAATFPQICRAYSHTPYPGHRTPLLTHTYPLPDTHIYSF